MKHKRERPPSSTSRAARQRASARCLWPRRVDWPRRWVARPFQPGVEYREAEVNNLLRGHEIDHVTLRRYLVDYGFLTRSAGILREAIHSVMDALPR